MGFTVIAVGKLKERYWREAADEYLTRLQPYTPTQVIEVPDERLVGDQATARTREAGRIRKVTPHGAYRLALTERGTLLGSEALARRMEQLDVVGQSAIAFWIGGAVGLDPILESEADDRLALSPMTYPHQLARVMLLEQLYRAARVRSGHPYHK